MNTSEMIETIADEVMDDTLTSDRILPLLNRAQLAIAKAINFPNLITRYSLTTVPDQPETTMPEDFHKNLFQAYVEGIEVDVMNSRKELFSEYGAYNVIGSGNIYAVAVEGRNLCYALIPSSAKEVELHYYRKPENMVDSADSYPELLQDDPDLDDALMYWVKWKFFQQIEQGIEGQKTDTNYNLGNYQKSLRNVKLSMREGESVPDAYSVKQPW